MVDPSPSFKKRPLRLGVPAQTGRPASQTTESMVDVGATMRSFQPFTTKGFLPGGIVEILPVDEIITRKGWAEYRRMLHDPQITSTMSFKKIMIYGRKWDVQPVSDDQKDKDVALFVSKVLKRLDFKNVLREIMTAFDYGFSVGEIIWEVTRIDGKQAIAIKAIKNRDPEFLTVKTDKHGNISSWVQDNNQFSNLRASQKIELMPSKVMHYAHNASFSQHYGKADLRACYRSWWAKKFIIQFWNVFLERMGSPLMTTTYPTGATPELKTALKDIMRGLSSKNEILIPEGVEISLLEATRSGQATYDLALAYHDKEIARALLMIALLGAGGNDIKRGSDSQSRIHLRTLHKMADEVGGSILWQFNRQVVRQLVDFNFDVDEYPEVFFQDYGEFEAFEITDAMRLLHAAGIIELDQEDVNFARSMLGMRVREEGDEDEVMRPIQMPPPGNANQPPPGAGQGNDNATKGGASGSETPGTKQ
jgi:phage gp29-like protein